MANSEKLCLQWNDFEDNITASFRDLRGDKEFTDITLACEDGKLLDAHKVVLASSSPFFMQLLEKIKQPEPFLYMRGLKSAHLAAVLDFLYCGEANIFQDDLDSFLALAEEFQLKGLTESTRDEEEPVEEKAKTKIVLQNKENVERKTLNASHWNSKSVLSKGSNDTRLALTNEKISIDLQDLDTQIRSMFTKSDARTSNGQGSLATCNICGKEGALKLMPQHIEANHITGVSHTCEVCGKVSRSRDSLRKHKTAHHNY